MSSLRELDGLIGAAHSPFAADGALNTDAVAAQAKLYREMGLIGVFVGGSTGEWFSLTLDERMALTQAWTANGDGLTVIAHVGGVSIDDARQLAEHAEGVGADAVSCLIQPDAGIDSIDGAVQYMADVTAAAPDTPSLYYDMTAVTGLDVPLDLLLEAAIDAVPTLAGAKYTNSDLSTITRAQQVSPKLQVLMGRDEMLLGAIATGVKGAVGSTYNYAAPVYHRIRDAVASGDLDAAQQANVEAVMFVKALLTVGVLPGAKAIMGWMGVDVGTPRPPHDTLTDHDAAAFHAAVKDMPVFARPLVP